MYNSFITVGLNPMAKRQDIAAAQAADPLTGLPGREVLEARMNAAIESGGGAEPVSLAVFDVDLLGRINRDQDRAAGDGAIALLADAAAEAFPGPDRMVCRFGGDAVAVLFAGMEKERAFMAAEEFRRSLAARLSVSAGVAACPDDADGAAALCIKATEALYRAKVSGRGKACLAREEKMVTKTSHYTQGQLMGLRRLAEREGIGEALLLREALNDLLRKHNS